MHSVMQSLWQLLIMEYGQSKCKLDHIDPKMEEGLTDFLANLCFFRILAFLKNFQDQGLAQYAKILAGF